jgi:hypothetical protein
VLSVVWLAFTSCGALLIAQATSVVQQRAFAQESADSIALAAAIGGAMPANRLAVLLGVDITHLDINADNVVVTVHTNNCIATSEATKGR